MDFKANSKTPVIFSFRVTKIKNVKTTADMKEWETLMAKNVGIKAVMNDSGTATTSCCPDCDDCDMD